VSVLRRVRHYLTHARIVLLALAVGACGGDSTGLGARIDVDVSLTRLDPPFISVDDEGGPLIRCDVALRAVARGSGGATWEGATFRWFVGKNATTPVDSAVLPAAEIQESWGNRDIAAGETQESEWAITAGVPFSLTIEYRYRSSGAGRVGTASVSFTCGPTIPPGAAPPVIASLTVQPSSGEVESGQTVTVAYTATSEVGLWGTAVELSACDTLTLYAERLEKSVTRTVSIPLSPSCQVNTPLHVTVYALDAALQETSRQAATQLMLVDRTPPQVTPLFFPPTGGSATQEIAGDYFTGDSLYLIFNASDNHSLRALVWEILPVGFRDSLVVSGPYASPWMKIPIRPEWTGQIQLRLYARDAAGLTSEAVTSAPGALNVSPTVVLPTAWTTVAGEIREFVIDAPRGAVYLLQTNESRVAVLSTATMTATRTVATPVPATDLDLSAGGDSLVLALPAGRALGIIDLRQPSSGVTLIPLAALDTTRDQRPWQVRVAANGKALVSLQGSQPSAYTLLEVDLATGTQRHRTDAGDGGFVGGGHLERSHDRSVIVVNGGPNLFQPYDATTDRFGPRRSATVSDWRPSVDRMGLHVAIGLDVYGETLLHLRRVRAPILGGIPRSALSADGEHLYIVLWNHGIVRSRVSDGMIVDRIPNPIGPDAIRASADGAMVITAEGIARSQTRISRIDLQ
jgi:hypothetical protein